jgi:hypothetical protein
MAVVIIILVILLFFLLSRDDKLIKTIKNNLFSTNTPEDNSNIEKLTLIEDDTEGAIGSEVYNNGQAEHTLIPIVKKFNNADLQNDKVYKAYSEDLNKTIDTEIIDSHEEYIADSDFTVSASLGASHGSINDHDDSMIKKIGIGGRRGGNVVHQGVESSARVTNSYTGEHIEDLKDQERNGIRWG